MSQTFRIGPARRGYDDPSYEEFSLAFEGNGLRPYSPVHLKVVKNNGDLDVRWIRRTRLDGDDWELTDVPLAEDTESYTVRVLQNGQIVREVVVGAQAWSYDNAVQTSDGLVGEFDIAVAQNSARYGVGPFKSISISGG